MALNASFSQYMSIQNVVVRIIIPMFPDQDFKMFDFAELINRVTFSWCMVDTFTWLFRRKGFVKFTSETSWFESLNVCFVDCPAFATIRKRKMRYARRKFHKSLQRYIVSKMYSACLYVRDVADSTLPINTLL